MKTLFVETASGSTYQLNPETKQLRRVGGEKPPTERQGPDNLWQTYHSIIGPIKGASMIVVWRVDTGADEEPIYRSTITSIVTSLSEMDKEPS